MPIGAGEVDLRGYIEALHAIGYQGALAVELEVADPENLPRYSAEAYRVPARPGAGCDRAIAGVSPMPSVTANGIQLHYEERGRASR